MTKPELARRMLTISHADFLCMTRHVRAGEGPTMVRGNCHTMKQANAAFQWVNLYGMINPTAAQCAPEVVAFPASITLRINPNALAEFKGSEEGSYEDAGGNSSSRCCDIDSPHVYVILERHRNLIEVRNANEAVAVYLAACSGTFQISYLATAHRICDALRQYVPAGWLKLWPRPAGV